MPSPHTDWTVEMVRAIPEDGNRYEVLDGVLLVSPAPSLLHQRTSRELVRRLLAYVDAVGLELFYAPTAVTWSSRTELQPDVLVWPLLDGRAIERFEDIGVLDLAVEILSPSTAHDDRYRKRLEYQRRKVAEYWIIDADARLVERWRPADDRPEILVDSLTWQPRADREALTIELEAFFTAARGVPV